MNESNQRVQTLTHKPLAEAGAAVKPILPWGETVKLINDFMDKGYPAVTAAAKIMERNTPIGLRGRPFKDAKSLAASISLLRKSLLAGAKSAPAPTPIIAELKQQLRNIMTLPGLDDRTRLQVIRAMIEA